MSLSLTDVLDEEDLSALRKIDLQYSSLVSFYRGLSKSKNEKMHAGGTSFLDLLIDSKFENAGGSKDIADVVHDVLAQKIRIGLIAVDQMPLKNIPTAILRMDSRFASSELILQVCQNDSRLQLESTDQGHVVMLSQCNTAEKSETHASTNHGGSGGNGEDEQDRLIRYFHKSKPNLLKAVQVDVQYKDLLRLYGFWSDLWNKGIEFVEWLLALSQFYCVSNFDKYKQNLNTILANEILKYVEPKNRTISDIVNHMCICMPSFIHQYTVLKVVKESTDVLKITEDTQNYEVGLKMVMKVPGTADQDFVSSKTNKDYSNEYEVMKLATCKYIWEKLCVMDIPRHVAYQLEPLFSLRVDFAKILGTYNKIQKEPTVRLMVENHGSFLHFLVEKGRIVHPTLIKDTFLLHLKTILAYYLWEASGVKPKKPQDFINLALTEFPEGLANEEFLVDAKIYIRDTCSDNEHEGQGLKMNRSDVDKEHYHDTMNPLTDLESSRVIHLLTGKPRFSEVCSVFADLPEIAVQTLAKNSMSFYEWIIFFCKRLMPYDVDALETHLQGLVQSQVAKMHTQEHCQMTIQQVHSKLCGDQPMLLSPNFISWCLKQKGSSFFVYQSWIYLRNDQPSSSQIGSFSPGPSTIQSENNNDCQVFLQSVKSSSTLQQIISVINCIPQNQIFTYLKPGICWYEYIENNVNHQERRKLVCQLVNDVDRILGGTVKKLGNLRVSICSGQNRFITIDILEEVLRQHRDLYALSALSGEDCYVACVRQLDDGNVKCVDKQEETFLEHILFFFPSGGSCHISSIMALANEDDSILRNETSKNDVNFLQCFFNAFPMLFYLAGNTVVLTCMALDYICECKGRRIPTRSDEKEHSAHRIQKRIEREREDKSIKPKKRKYSPSAEKRDEVDWVGIGPGQDTKVPSPDDAVTYVRDNSSDCGNLTGVIDNLLPDLVGDMTMSILKENDGQLAIYPLLRNLASLILTQDEAVLIVRSGKHWSRFKQKIAAMIDVDARFVTISAQDGMISDVMIAETKPHLGYVKGNSGQGVAQVEEVTSTSVSPVPENTRALSGLSPDRSMQYIRLSPHDVIKMTPPESENSSVENNPSNPAPSIEFNDITKEIPDNRPGLNSSRPADQVIRSETDVGPLPSQSNTAYPEYHSLLVGSSAYKYKPVVPKQNEVAAKGDRKECFSKYVFEYLRLNAGTCHTESLIADAYRSFQEEHFARSPLAFEAYMFDFIGSYNSPYRLTGSDGKMGISKITLTYTQDSRKDAVRHVLWNLVPRLCPLCAAFLSSKAATRAPIEEVCQFIIDSYPNYFESFAEPELGYVVRCVTLISLIRNLKLFCFAVKEPVVYLRGHKEAATTTKKCLAPEIVAKLKLVMKNDRLHEAILIMADVVRKIAPASTKAVRQQWEKEAPSSIAGVFGTGISFTIALREYSYIFQPSGDGKITVSEDAMDFLTSGYASSPN